MDRTLDSKLHTVQHSVKTVGCITWEDDVTKEVSRDDVIRHTLRL